MALSDGSTEVLNDSRYPTISVDLDSISCDFESSDICGYSQSRLDNFDWSRNSGQTTTTSTGPLYDHTLGRNNRGHYMYTEASYKQINDVARLTSQLTSRKSGSHSIGFYYHMYGSGIGTLNVYVTDGRGNLTNADFSVSGNQGKTWLQGCVDITDPTLFSIVFEAVEGKNSRGDIAIDDVTLNTGTCLSNGIAKSIINANYSNLSCNFDTSYCSYLNDSTADINWIRHTGSTITEYTGPSQDHTTFNGTGYYLYIESSAPATSGDKARILSPLVSLTGGQYSVSFWYHMYGREIATLNIYVDEKTSYSNNGNQGNYYDNHYNGNQGYHSNQGNQYYYGSYRKRPDFVAKGNQSDIWKHGCLDITDKSGTFRLVFEAVRGSSFHGDIAIDDIEVMPYTCNVAKKITKSTTKPSTSSLPTVTTTILQRTSSRKSTIRPLGTWSKWYQTECPVTCGEGTSVRIRQCNTGHVEDCEGNSTEIVKCNTKPCQAGTWSNWNNVECPVTCGRGTSIRIRQCTSGHVEDCAGNATEQITCTKKPCPIVHTLHCTSAPCQNGATCEELPGTFNCFCPRGFVGPICGDDFDECVFGNTCNNKGSCINTYGNFTCICQNGFTGLDCGTRLAGHIDKA